MSMLDSFISGLRSTKTGAIVTNVHEMRENQFGIPLKHYAQQYLFGATGLRIQVFNSIQGPKEVGKSTMMFDLMGDVCGAEEDGGYGGLAVLYELEGKISPSILYSILNNHGPRALEACIPRLGMTLEESMADLNKVIIPMYEKACPKRDKPLMIGFDSIGGSSSVDTIEKLEKEGVAGKGFWNKQHFMKYFCENQGAIFVRRGIPVVVILINQEKEELGTMSNVPAKTITGGKAQMFKDGHMISATKSAYKSGSGNTLHLKTFKTSYCDARKLDVDFRWNIFGQKHDDAYEAHFLWALASAKLLANPERVGEIRSICDVKVSDKELVTCPQLGLRSVPAEEFEAALMSNGEILDQLYTYQKIERLRDISEYPSYWKRYKALKEGKDDIEIVEKQPEVIASAPVEEAPKPVKGKGKGRKTKKQLEDEATALMDMDVDASFGMNEDNE